MPDEQLPINEPAPAPIRLALLSEVAFSEGTPAQPIHALRVGTFTGMSGTPTTFEPRHLRQMAERLNETAARRRPPINENHDYGRAVGRMLRAYTRNRDHDLYIEPKWLSAGRTLLSDEVYDGFSIELAVDGDGFSIVGGALTNYPAVDGLATVTLSAPSPQGPAHEDTPPIATEEHRMSGETHEIQDAPETTPAVAPALPPVNDAAMQAQINAYVAQMEARFKAQQDAAFARAQQEFERRIVEMEQQRQIEAYAQHITTPTLTRPHALPGHADDWARALRALSAEQRKVWQPLLDTILSSGLVSFEEIGSAGEGETEQDARARYQALVNAKVDAGMARVAAIKAVNREHPDLYAAQSAPKGR